MLVCDLHKSSKNYLSLLKTFKADFIEKFEHNLTPFNKNIKISFYSESNCVSAPGEQSASENQKSDRDNEAIDQGIFMLQQISIAGYTFNLFYDSGCGDLVCKKSAIDKLMRIGRAKQEIPGTNVLSGVGENKVVCKEGIYKINLPLDGGSEAIMSGVCV